MWTFALNALLSSALISFTTWLAGKKPALAGFLLALPLSSLIAIALVQGQWKDPEKSAEFARSIFVSIPLSLTFFLPFLFARQLKMPFWALYGSGVALLFLSYAAHRWLFSGTD